MTCACAICSRVFEVSELYKKMVEKGMIDPECSMCDGSDSYEEDANPIGAAEYRYEDR